MPAGASAVIRRACVPLASKATHCVFSRPLGRQSTSRPMQRPSPLPDVFDGRSRPVGLRYGCLCSQSRDGDDREERSEWRSHGALCPAVTSADCAPFLRPRMSPHWRANDAAAAKYSTRRAVFFTRGCAPLPIVRALCAGKIGGGPARFSDIAARARSHTKGDVSRPWCCAWYGNCAGE